MPHKLTRREFIESAVATTTLAASGVVHGAPARRPNVLFILADDLGYGDLSCYGRPDYKTPVLDAFAKQGVMFTDNYAATPVCSLPPHLAGVPGLRADARRLHPGPLSAASAGRSRGAPQGLVRRR